MSEFPEQRLESVVCNGPDNHTIKLESDPSGKRVPRITLLNHNEEEIDAESVICRMNGKLCGCMEFLNNWRNHHKFELVSSDGCRWEVEYEVINDIQS